MIGYSKLPTLKNVKGGYAVVCEVVMPPLNITSIVFHGYNQIAWRVNLSQVRIRLFQKLSSARGGHKCPERDAKSC